MTSSRPTFYLGRQVAFLTQHGKQDLVREPLETALGCQLVHTEGFDTDQLGSFTREQARPGSQLDAARQKATIGMALTGAHLGLASEGSFGPDPFGGFIPWNTEVVLWVDQVAGIEVTGFAHGPAQSLHRTVKTTQELHRFAADAGFPEHHLVLRPGHQNHPAIYKNLSDIAQLEQAFDQARQQVPGGEVFAENDLRAFANPTRQLMIRKATDELIQKLRSACPVCATPGFWLSQQIPGLPCRSCGMRTRLPKGEIWRCTRCTHEEQRESASGPWADPGRCDVCNP